jgi:hypothetical protein
MYNLKNIEDYCSIFSVSLSNLAISYEKLRFHIERDVIPKQEAVPYSFNVTQHRASIASDHRSTKHKYLYLS